MRELGAGGCPRPGACRRGTASTPERSMSRPAASRSARSVRGVDREVDPLRIEERLPALERACRVAGDRHLGERGAAQHERGEGERVEPAAVEVDVVQGQALDEQRGGALGIRRGRRVREGLLGPGEHLVERHALHELARERGVGEHLIPAAGEVEPVDRQPVDREPVDRQPVDRRVREQQPVDRAAGRSGAGRSAAGRSGAGRWARSRSRRQ